MSTEFYWIEDREQQRPIGVRAGAGNFCFDCKVPLSSGPAEEIHTGKHKALDACPKCGTKPNEETTPDRYGVGYSSSFTWLQDPAAVKDRAHYSYAANCIWDEYHTVYTGEEFLAILNNHTQHHFEGRSAP